MWLKLLLLCLYLLMIFLLSRLLEAVSWYSEDKYLVNSRTILDPFALSVRKLKQLLDSRGVSYVGVVEKQELSSLLETSGQVTEAEMQDAIEEEAHSVHSTVHFTCGSHFYEEVEDTKDSVWLVQVVSEMHPKPLLDDQTWQQTVSKVFRFGVRTGVFECSLDPHLCARKGWTSSRLILALPHGNTAKQDVVIHSYLYPAKSHQSVLQWITQQLASRIHRIPSSKHLKSKWLSTEKSNSLLQVILVSTLTESPLFLSALAVKFTGRVRFGMIRSDKLPKDLKRQLRTTKLPLYLVINPANVRVYGSVPGEVFDYRSLELYLKTLRPEMNDLFLLSIFLANIAVGLEMFLVGGKLWRHAIRWFLQLVRINFILLVFWLLVLGMNRFHFQQTTTDVCLRLLHAASESKLSSTLRNDWKRLYSPSFFGTTFLGFGLLIGLLWKLSGYGNGRDAPLFSDWWSVPWDSYLMNYFFRPMATLTRPMGPHDLDFEEGMEMLIDRLAMPNLWLQPVIPTDYIQNLPVWKYSGWSEAENKNHLDVLSSSEDEGAALYFPAIPTTSDTDRNCPPKSSHKYSSKFMQRAAALRQSLCCFSRNKKAKSESVASQQHKCRRKEENLEASERQLGENKAPWGMLECQECSICLENYQHAELLCGLPCGHNYHLTCIMLWLSRDNHCCPSCRWPPFRPNPKTAAQNQHAR